MAASSSSPRGVFWTHAAALLWTLLLLALLLLPGGQPYGGDLGLLRNLDKLGHFCLFLAETLLLQRSFLYSLPRRSSLQLAAAMAIVLALITEIGQLWVPRRSFEGLDLVADAAGVGLGILLIRWRRGDMRSEL